MSQKPCWKPVWNVLAIPVALLLTGLGGAALSTAGPAPREPRERPAAGQPEAVGLTPEQVLNLRHPGAALSPLPFPKAAAPRTGPDDWCPTSRELTEGLRRAEALRRLQAAAAAQRVPARGMPGSGRMTPAASGLDSVPHGGPTSFAPQLPNAVFENNVVVMEDNGTLLANDNPIDLEGYTFDFTPGAQGYTAEAVPFVYDTGVGNQIVTAQGGFFTQQVSLSVITFPFAGADRLELFLNTSVGIYFSPPRPLPSDHLKMEQVLFDRTLRICPMVFGSGMGAMNIFLREDLDRVVVTWQEAADPNRLDVQAVLFADGRIRFAYKSLKGINHGTMVIYPDAAMWSDTLNILNLNDPVDVSIGYPEQAALDVIKMNIHQSRNTEVLGLSLLLQQAPPAGSHALRYECFMKDEQGDADNAYFFNFEIQNGALSWSSEPTLQLNGDSITFNLLATRMALSDRDFGLILYTWLWDDGWYFGDAVEVYDLVIPTDPDAVMIDATVQFPLTSPNAIFECFTLPELRPYAVYDAFRSLFGDPRIDGLAIYQNFLTDLILYAGAYSTVGNAAADGIGVGNSADPIAPALLHMNTMGYGWNSWGNGIGLVLNHEFGHHWLYFISILEGGSPTRSLNPASAHPAGWVHMPAPADVVTATDCSCMGGSTWTDNGDGSFTASSFCSHSYAWDELYLMGLAAPAEVTDWYYIANPDPGLPSSYWPPDNITVTGDRVDVTLQQIIDVHGPRYPDSTGSQRDFNVPFVLVVRPGQWNSGESAALSGYCATWAPFFKTATLDRATVTCDAPLNHVPDGVIDTPATSLTITTGSAVDFTSTGTDPDGDLPLSFSWTFGGARPRELVEDPGPLIFDTVGTYTVALTVTDAKGLDEPFPDTRVIEVVCGPVEGIGNSLRLWRTPAGELEFTWSNLAAPPDDYVLVEDLAADGNFSTILDSGLDGAAGIQIPEPPGGRIYYHVAGRNLPDCIGPF